jgi:hypothetical protein
MAEFIESNRSLRPERTPSHFEVEHSSSDLPAVISPSYPGKHSCLAKSLLNQIVFSTVIYTSFWPCQHFHRQYSQNMRPANNGQVSEQKRRVLRDILETSESADLQKALQNLDA